MDFEAKQFYALNPLTGDFEALYFQNRQPSRMDQNMETSHNK